MLQRQLNNWNPQSSCVQLWGLISRALGQNRKTKTNKQKNQSVMFSNSYNTILRNGCSYLTDFCAMAFSIYQTSTKNSDILEILPRGPTIWALNVEHRIFWAVIVALLLTIFTSESEARTKSTVGYMVKMYIWPIRPGLTQPDRHAY